MVLCIRLALRSLVVCIKVCLPSIKVCGVGIHIRNTVGLLVLVLVGLVLPGCYYFLGQIDAAKPGVPLCCRVSNQTALRAYAHWLWCPLGLSRELRQMPPALTRACICVDPLGLRAGLPRSCPHGRGVEPHGCAHGYARYQRRVRAWVYGGIRRARSWRAPLG